MDKNEVIDLLKEHYDFLKNEYGISKIGIFGSIVRGQMTKDSDLDIVVEFKKPIGYKFIKLTGYLEKLFNRKVDVLTKDGIKNIRVKQIEKNIQGSLIYV